MSGLPLNKSTLFTPELDSCRGKVVFLVTPTPCTGVSITDLVAPPLEEPHERENMRFKYVCVHLSVCYLQCRSVKIEYVYIDATFRQV